MYYRRLDAGGRERLLRTLSQDFSVQSSEVDQAIVAWQQALQRSQKDRQQQQAAAGRSPVQQEQQAQQQDAPDDQAAEAVSRSAQRLAAASQPLYSRLFLPISQQHCGIKFLVDLRADLQECIRRQPRGSASLRGLSDSLRRVLAEWFSVGLLQLRRLTWEGTPAALLEKVMAYEAVHSMAGWSDLRQRLGPARRVFAFFHQAMPQEPLVVLHTALLRCPPAASMEEIFSGSHDSPDAPTTAVFYSITSTQRGLAGVDLGNFLIKQASQPRLGRFLQQPSDPLWCRSGMGNGKQQEFPSLTTLCTLSPMPGFADWLAMRAARGRQGLDPTPLLLPGELQQLGALAAKHLDTQAGGLEGSPQQAAAVLQWALQGDPWVHNPHLEEALRPAMLRLAAVYLVQEKRRGLALDPVANFHLRNGAELWRLNWRADTSPAFLAQSHGLMANYVYRLEEVAGNNRRYLVDEEVVVGPEVEQLLGEGGGKEV
ncbi:hypothetical protein N2152v2_007323 [Parachlorella kessleri]